MIVLVSLQKDPSFETILKQLKGKYASECIKKIHDQGGKIVAVNTTSHAAKAGEVIHFTSQRADVDYCLDVCTDDPEMKFCKKGPIRDQSGNNLFLRAVISELELRERMKHVA